MSKTKITICAVLIPSLILASSFWLGVFSPKHKATTTIQLTPSDNKPDSSVIDCFNPEQNTPTSDQNKTPNIIKSISSKPNLRKAIVKYKLDELSNIDTKELANQLDKSTSITFNKETNSYQITTTASTPILAEQYNYAIITTFRDEQRKHMNHQMEQVRLILIKQLEPLQQKLDESRRLYKQITAIDENQNGTQLHYSDDHFTKISLARDNVELNRQRLTCCLIEADTEKNLVMLRIAPVAS